MIKILILLLISQSIYAECIHERYVTGLELQELSESTLVETEKGLYKSKANIKVDLSTLYKVQENPANQKSSISNLKYYDYPRMEKYLSLVDAQISKIDYKKQVIGKSLKGYDLFYIGPKNLQPKKTIIMFGRHHGDEGTANWIIEGFLNKYLADRSFSEEYQLLLYPMINPDGAQAKSRYNSKGRDLNRSWSSKEGDDLDEIKIIHGHLRDKMKVVKDHTVIVLDMHGSFTEDFIYRVKRSFAGRRFYNLQQEFIDTLAKFDFWQKGNDKPSNGDPGMARIVMVNHYGKNALTHETPREISIRNSRGRSIETLMSQGDSIISAIKSIY